MKINKKLVFIILFILLLSYSLLLLNEGNSKKIIVYNVSVITRGKNSDAWSRMKAGMEQATSEMNVNLNFISLLEENSSSEQKDILEREMNSKTDAIIISPADYTELSSLIENINKKIPIVLFESKIDTKQNIPYVSCDNYELGKILAEEVIKNGNTRSNIGIIKSNLSYSSTKERYDGFIQEISQSKNSYELIEIPLEDSDLYNKIKSLMEENKFDVIVSFDTNTLESIGKAKKYVLNNIKTKVNNIELYGTGCTSAVISLIEENIINSISMQNEFNVGYLSVKSAVLKIEGKKKNKTVNITSTIINSRNMYFKENQKLLFPIIR